MRSYFREYVRNQGRGLARKSLPDEIVNRLIDFSHRRVRRQREQHKQSGKKREQQKVSERGGAVPDAILRNFGFKFGKKSMPSESGHKVFHITKHSACLTAKLRETFTFRT